MSEFTIGGTHSFDNEIAYTVSLPLVNYNKHDGENIDKERHLNIVMHIDGTTDEYDVDVEEKEILRSIKSVIKQSFRKEEVDQGEIQLDLETEESLIELD